MAAAAQQINSLRAQLSIGIAPDHDLMAAAYLKFKAEGLLEAIYHDRPPTLLGFLELCRETPDRTSRACLYRPLLPDGTADPERCELAGWGWCFDIRRYPKNATGEIGLAFFRNFQQRGIAEEFTAMMIDECFGRVGLDVLRGYSMRPNRSARFMALRMGFEILAPIPGAGSWRGETCDAESCYLTRSRWEEKSRDAGS